MRGWTLTIEPGEALTADGVVLTGTGAPIRVAGQPRDHPRVLDGRSYWLHDHSLHKRVAQSVCVIGSGETAASVVISLLKKSHRRSTVDVLTSRGVLYSRGESYDENRFYSDPGEWPRLAESHRREFLERTDRGVFSLQAEASLRQSRGFRTLAGRAAAIEAGEQQVVVTIEYGDERERVAYDLVVVAIGFDAHWFKELLGSGKPPARERACRGLGRASDRRRSLDRRLELATPRSRGRRPRAGPGLPELELSRAPERPRPSPLRPARGPTAGVAAERRELV
jgi:mycobactin lysine-N-oxygenase